MRSLLLQQDAEPVSSLPTGGRLTGFLRPVCPSPALVRSKLFIKSGKIYRESHFQKADFMS